MALASNSIGVGISTTKWEEKKGPLQNIFDEKGYSQQDRKNKEHTTSPHGNSRTRDFPRKLHHGTMFAYCHGMLRRRRWPAPACCHEFSGVAAHGATGCYVGEGMVQSTRQSSMHSRWLWLLSGLRWFEHVWNIFLLPPIFEVIIPIDVHWLIFQSCGAASTDYEPMSMVTGWRLVWQMISIVLAYVGREVDWWWFVSNNGW